MKTPISTSPRTVRVACASVCVALLLVSPRLWADLHRLPLPPAAAGDWDVWVRLNGSDSQFWEEGPANQYAHALLYTASKEVEISVYADFKGQLPPEVVPLSLRLEMLGPLWTVEGGVATRILPMTNGQVLNESLVVAGRAVLETSDTNWTPSVLFEALVHVAFPITVSAGSAVGGMLPVYAYSVLPHINTNAPHYPRVEHRLTPLPGAVVTVAPVAGVHVRSADLITSEVGRAMATVWADASAPQEGGLVPGQVRLTVRKDSFQLQREQSIRIPYAMVISALGAELVHRPGSIADPRLLFSGDLLLPGDVVRVGTEFVGGNVHLRVRFCNGQEVVLTAQGIGGTRAIVGQGSLDRQTALLKVALDNLAVDIRTDPRRYGRMLVYKALGNVVDGFLGLPDPVGWFITTPGGIVEDWLIDFGESAYQPQPSQPPSLGPIQAANGSGLEEDIRWAAAVVDFYSDGTVRVFNGGVPSRIRSPARVGRVALGGTSVGRWTVPGGEISAPGVMPLGGAPPVVTELEPMPEAQDVPVRPRFRLRFSEVDGNPVVPGSLNFRLDGRLLNSHATLHEGEVLAELPPGEALSPGPHRWEIELATLQGALLRTSITFTVSSQLPPPHAVEALAGQRNVLLRWSPESLAWAHGGFRVYRTAPGGSPLLLSGPEPLRQPNFVDSAPLPQATYRVVALTATGAEGLPSEPLSVTFPGATQPIPGELRVTVEVPGPGLGPALRIQDRTHTWTLWRIEAAVNPDGPFQDVLGGELTSLDLWPVPRPFEETRRWYRVTSVNVDGQAGASVTVGPLPLPVPPPAVTGLSASLNPDGTVLLRWDPWTARPITGYLVEQWTGTAWQTLAEPGPDVTAWIDRLSPAQAQGQWRVLARLPAGNFSPPSPPVGLTRQPLPTQPGLIRFATQTISAEEGQTVTLQVVREGGSDGAGFVTWSTWTDVRTAVPDHDFSPRAGLLIFESGQTTKTIQIPLLPDNHLETEPEFFEVTLRNVEGGPARGEPSTARVWIIDGPRLEWQTTWFTAAEGSPSEVGFTVILTRPAPYEVRVDYRFDPSSSTATRGVDFLGPDTGTLIFAPGETNKSFTVTLINDSIKEPAETVKYLLFNSQNAAIDRTDPFRAIATLEIVDDDTRPGRAVFEQRQIQLREGESRQITLRRVDGSDGMLTALLFPMGGTAHMDQDWTLSPGLATFNDGETEWTVTLHAINDDRSEGVETVVLGMQTVGQFGAWPTLLILISDAELSSTAFDQWANQLLAAQPPAQRSPEADPDTDRLPNWMEFLWLTQPDRADPPLRPALTILPWGGLEATVTVREDPVATVIAEFASDVLFSSPQFDVGSWQSNPDGTRTGTFRSFGLPGSTGFLRLRCYWMGGP